MIPCYQGYKGDFNKAGHCCCSCYYQKPITKHPWNKTEVLKGSITEIVGYGCQLPELDSIVIMEREHSLCEMWRDKDERSDVR